MRWTKNQLGLLCGVFFAASLPAAEEPVDPDFLEFLGTVDSNEAGWHDYLASAEADDGAKEGATNGADPSPPAPESENGKEEPP